MDDTTLETRRSIFNFSDPKDFRFYAPAFMQYAVRNHDTSAWGHFIVDGIIYSLSPDNNVFKKVPFEACFTPEQIAAIERFLEYCIAHHDTLDGLEAAETLRRIRQRIEDKTGDG